MHYQSNSIMYIFLSYILISFVCTLISYSHLFALSFNSLNIVIHPNLAFYKYHYGTLIFSFRNSCKQI